MATGRRFWRMFLGVGFAALVVALAIVVHLVRQVPAPADSRTTEARAAFGVAPVAGPRAVGQGGGLRLAPTTTPSEPAPAVHVPPVDPPEAHVGVFTETRVPLDPTPAPPSFTPPPIHVDLYRSHQPTAPRARATGR